MEEYKSLLEKLTNLVNALENGELSLDELMEMEETTRKLHERSIILRYNAFREKVTGEPTPEVVEEVKEPEVAAEPEIVPEPAPEPEVEVPQEEEEQAFDFAIFDEYEETPGTASVEPEPEVAEVTEEESSEEQPEPEPEVEEEEPAAEPVVETPVEEEKPAEPEVEETEEPAPEPVTESKPAAGNASFLDRLSEPDNSIAGRFAAGKLDTLIGAFGLNERLRYINDLFDGSSEAFSDAIKKLDSQNDLDAARNVAAGYATQNDWDPEEDAVIEFMNYLNRRYA